MFPVVIVAINARYGHASFGARYLLANMGHLLPMTCLLEFEIHQTAERIARSILEKNPRIVGLGVYIWNTGLVLEVIQQLKAARPDMVIILGGPEISYEAEEQPHSKAADYIITGEADLEFANLCAGILAGAVPREKIIAAQPPPLDQVVLPYDLYSESDLAHRTIYVEASRGCAFRCAYCLSARDKAVRHFPLAAWREAMQKLLARGLKKFKFTDRTFNLQVDFALNILSFFREHYVPGLLLHFEMIPDRFPRELRQALLSLPRGSLHLEIGLQTFNEDVARLICRSCDYSQVDDNLRFLINDVGSAVHTDLIAGLPGEGLASFASGFDRLVRLNPAEIQVGILKRLRGAPMQELINEWQLQFDGQPPYALRQSKSINAEEMERVARFARFWEITANRQRFPASLPLLWEDNPSPFAAFMRWSDWLFKRCARTFAVPLPMLAEALYEYLTTVLGKDPAKCVQLIAKDYQAGGLRREIPLGKA